MKVGKGVGGGVRAVQMLDGVARCARQMQTRGAIKIHDERRDTNAQGTLERRPYLEQVRGQRQQLWSEGATARGRGRRTYSLLEANLRQWSGSGSESQSRSSGG